MAARLRCLAPSRGYAPRIVRQFDPIVVEEVDIFAFDFTQDAGNANIVASRWNCRTTPFSSVVDLQAETRVAISGAGVQNTFRYRDIDGSLQMKRGCFGVAVIGPIPPAMAGATYILDCTAFFSDDRQVALNATVQCVLFGLRS